MHFLDLDPECHSRGVDTFERQRLQYMSLRCQTPKLGVQTTSKCMMTGEVGAGNERNLLLHLVLQFLELF